MNFDINFKRNFLISLIFILQALSFSIFFLCFQNSYLNFPALIILIFSAAYLIFINLEVGLIVYIGELLVLGLIFIITRYSGTLSFYFFLAAVVLGIRSTFKKKKSLKNLNDLGLELESIKERTNVNTSQYLELVKINEALEKKTYRFTNLRKFSEEMLASLNLNELLKIITHKAMEIIGKGQVCMIYMFDYKNETLHLANSFTLSSKIRIKAKTGDPCEHWVFRQRVPLLITDILRDFRFDSEEVFSYGREFRSLISAPIISRNKLLGIIRIDSNYPDEFTADDLRLLDIIADLSAIAIDNAFLFQRMEELATQDSLTGFYLRREFSRILGRELKKSQLTKRKDVCALLMLDIDDFKVCNDTYGHIAGDMVLRNIARIINRDLKEEEYPCRYGGEEFLLFIRGKDKNQLLQRAEKIRKDIGESVIKVRRQNLRVTVSIGIAVSPEESSEPGKLIEIADARLYKAKRSGKNRAIYD